MPAHRLLLWWPVALLSLWLFSPAQHESFLWGIQFITYVPLACLTAVLVAVVAGASLPVLLVTSALCSTVATFSYANGTLIWSISVPVLASARWQEVKASRLWWGLWAGTWLANAWLYFGDFRENAMPATEAVAGSPSDAVEALLAFVGSGLSQGSAFDGSGRFDRAVAFGLMVLISSLAASAYLRFTRRSIYLALARNRVGELRRCTACSPAA